MSGSTHDDELAAFQTALARLTPAEGISIAQLLFQAGRLSVPRRSWVWPCTTAASMMLAITLGTALVFRPAPQPTERIVQVFVQPPAPPTAQVERPVPAIDETPDAPPPASDGDYLQLRREVLAKGVDALPPPAPWPTVTPTEDADTLLDLPPDGRKTWFLHLKRSLKPGDTL